MADTKYLKQRGNTWYAYVRVPTDLREHYASPHVVRSLQTTSLKEAQLRRHSVVGEIVDEFESKRVGAAKSAAEIGFEFRNKLLKADKYERVIDSFGKDQGSEWEVQRSNLLDEIIDLDRSGKREEADEIYRIMESSSPLLSQMVDLWMSDSTTKHLTEQTKRQYKADTARFLKWTSAQRKLLVSDVDKRFAGRYVSEDLHVLAPKTINRHISCLSSLWRWMEKRGHTETNPWSGQGVPVKGKGAVRRDNPKRRLFTTDEIITLLKGLSPPVSELFRLGLYTGARIDELASLKLSDIESHSGSLWLFIRAGKTRNAVRKIPVHPLILPVVERLMQGAKAATGNSEGWLFPSATPGGPDQKKGWNISKKFGRERRALEIVGTDTVFHSLRMNFAEVLEASGVPLPTVKLLIGHERNDMTFGVYSKGNLEPIPIILAHSLRRRSMTCNHWA